MTAGFADLEQRAQEALATGREVAVEAEIGRWLTVNGSNPRMLQWRALLLRALDRRAEALPLLHDAAALAPDDFTIAHSLAQTALEAGVAAVTLFEAALLNNPASTEVRLGLTSARFAEGHGDQALHELGAALAHNPGWYGGHRQYAQLSAMLGRGDDALGSLYRTIDAFPDALDPSLLALELAMAAGQHEAALALAATTAKQHGDVAQIAEFRAAALDELQRAGEAAELFERLGSPGSVDLAVRRIRHHLRGGNFAKALREAEPWLATDDATQVWPYVALAWRANGDRQAAWLEDQAGLVSQIDFAADTIGTADLAVCLRAIHAQSGRFLDQSVRLGTQTDGALFARIEPEIVRIRSLLSGAVAEHIAQLPKPDPHHPQLAPRRDQTPRFAGSWSVRLSAEGHHARHHHPHGWFSSAFYVTGPEGLTGTEGQLELGGSPIELGLGLAPLRLIEPKPGRLVIFPSTLWHGTVPFRSGERMTIAFDVAYPFEEVDR